MRFTQQDLEDKIKELYQVDEIPDLIYNQINQYVGKRRWSYLEIARALAYYFVEKKVSPDITKGIGIVPYVMDESRKYFKQEELRKKEQKELSEQFQKQKTSRYDIECKQLPKVERNQRPLIDIGAISFEEEEDD